MYNFEFFTKENFALIGVIVLFVWRVIDVLIRLKNRRVHERERLAFDIAKLKVTNNDSFIEESSILSHYFICLEALEKNNSNIESYEQWLQEKENELNTKITEYTAVTERLNEAGERFEELTDIGYYDLYEKRLSWHNIFIDLKDLLTKIFKSNKKI